jgi:hypothetical protein
MAETPATPTDAPQRPANPALEKLERDVLRLLETISEMTKAGEKQTLRAIAEKSGLSKDEVNRYLNPQVNEVYNYDRLLGVRGRNRPLYNHLIVSGPPHVIEQKWAGINANTSKFVLFKAVANRFGYEVRFLGAAGQIVDIEYRGIDAMTPERMGKAFATQEPTLHL